MAASKGDFMLMDYTAKVKETGSIFDTSLADVAKQANIYKENTVYEPMLVVVGEGWVLRGLDEKLVGLEVAEKKTIEVPPEGAFGPRDPNKIKLTSLRKFQEGKVTPYPGLEVEIDGKLAVVRSVGAGRVQVDFNPPLAGRTLIYDIEVKRILVDPLEKIQALIHRRIPSVDVGKFKVEFSEKNVTVNVPEEAFALDRLQLAKRGVVADIQKFLPEIEAVTFIEKYLRKEAKSVPERRGEGEKP